ncbi:SseB family protein [Pseudoxanthomonas mexicana]
MDSKKPSAVNHTLAEVELEASLERCRTDPGEEPAFFRRLLESTVYAHAPASDDSGRLRLVQFRHPDGFDAIPFFTSMAKAQFAASSAVRILEVVGRDLLSGTRGATLMLNPNDGGAVLYPEEVATLLDTGFLARVEKSPSTELQVRPAQNAPAWLGTAIEQCLQGVDFVSAAYILETGPLDEKDQPSGLLICLVADMALGERAARLVMTAIQPLCAGLNCIIDLTIYDDSQPLPEHLVQPELVPVFKRSEANPGTSMYPEDKLLMQLPELTEEEKDRRTREGLADVDAGRTIPHEELLRWVRGLSKPS